MLYSDEIYILYSEYGSQWTSYLYSILMVKNVFCPMGAARAAEVKELLWITTIRHLLGCSGTVWRFGTHCLYLVLTSTHGYGDWDTAGDGTRVPTVPWPCSIHCTHVKAGSGVHHESCPEGSAPLSVLGGPGLGLACGFLCFLKSINPHLIETVLFNFGFKY